MSAIFDVFYDNTVFLVEIGRDGTMVILEPKVSLEYDIAFVAMGGNESPALKLTRRWEADPISVTTSYLIGQGQKRFQLYLLSLDWAEHVLYIYKAMFPGQHKRLLKMLQTARGAYRSGAHATTLIKNQVNACATAAVDLANSHTLHTYHKQTTAWSAWHAVTALSNAVHEDPNNCAYRAASATARIKGLEQGTEAFEIATKKERAWQIRRMVDIVEATNEGKPWPPMEATE